MKIKLKQFQYHDHRIRMEFFIKMYNPSNSMSDNQSKSHWLLFLGQQEIISRFLQIFRTLAIREDSEDLKDWTILHEHSNKNRDWTTIRDCVLSIEIESYLIEDLNIAKKNSTATVHFASGKDYSYPENCILGA